VCSNQGSIKGALGGKAKAKVEEMLALIHTDVRGVARARVWLWRRCRRVLRVAVLCGA
jgi:hypothetical protein